MPFPIVFLTPMGEYDQLTPVLNRSANAALVAAGSTSLALITCLALKALGYSAPIIKMTSMLPIAFAVSAGAAVVVSTALMIYAVASVLRVLRD
jgi:hypothetical protein